MNPILREYLLKGVFLTLWAYLCFVQPPAGPDWPRFGSTLGFVGGGLLLGLIVGAAVQVRIGIRPGRNLLAFALLVLLNSPLWIYAGVVGGLGVGIVVNYDQFPAEGTSWLTYFVLGGLLIGYGFWQLRQIAAFVWRFALAAVIGAALIYLAVYYIAQVPGWSDVAARKWFGWYLLIGVPFFYLLTFCGEAEESEVEIAAISAAVGLGLFFAFAGGATTLGDKAIFLASVGLYYVYVVRIMPGLRVFKHTLRGYGYLNAGRPVEAITSLRRAIRLDPTNKLANDGLWAVHERIDVTRVPADDPILRHLDFDFCLEKAATELLGDRPPTPAARAKAVAMLDLVDRLKPQLAPRVDYLRAVAFTHAKQFDVAATTLTQLLNPETVYDAAVRRGVLFPAWNLALRLHPEIVARIGEAELAKPGRRMEAIAATERQLAAVPGDPSAVELKAILYSGLTETEFAADAASGPPADFNYEYTEQLGLALIDDPEKRDRGAAYLRIAGRGLPERGPTIFAKLAAVAADPDEARGYLGQVKRSGLLVGPAKLADDQKAVYFDALKKLSADAEARGEFDVAIDDLRLFMEAGKGELESYRKLADLYEKAKSPLNALLMTETALVYNGKDRDLLGRKDKYYYSVDPAELAAKKDKVASFFDTEYCIKKAKQLLDQKDADAEILDWATHLSALARVMKPEANGVRVIAARGLLRKGDRDAALTLLEDLREAKKGSGDEEESWYQGAKLLGDLYLGELNRPDLAVGCFLAYRDYSKSGADTLFQIARSYEAMDDKAKAIQFYEAVTAYDQHPRYWEATEAVRRLKAGG